MTFSPRSNSVTRKLMLWLQSGATAGEDVLWAVTDGTLSMVDLATGELTRQGELPPGDVVFSVVGNGGFRRLSGHGLPAHPAIHQFNPTTGAEDVTVELPRETTPIAMALWPGVIWILNYEGTLTQVEVG